MTNPLVMGELSNVIFRCVVVRFYGFLWLLVKLETGKCFYKDTFSKGKEKYKNSSIYSICSVEKYFCFCKSHRYLIGISYALVED